MDTTAVRRREPEEGTTPAGELHLERRADGRLWAVRGDSERAVWVRRCFPWSEPARFVSLRDDEEREVALVRDPAELDPASRRVLEEAMVAAGFVFEIIRAAVSPIRRRVTIERKSATVATAVPFNAARRSPVCRPALPQVLPGLVTTRLSVLSAGGCHAYSRRSAVGCPSRPSAGIHETWMRIPMSRRYWSKSIGFGPRTCVSKKA